MPSSRVRIGSEEHKALFCRAFIETHEPFEPEALPWPDLDGRSLQRLRAVPFWGTALQIERNAGYLVNAFAETVADPLIREAIALQGYEENRHSQMLQMLVQRYGLQADIEQALPAPTKRAFIDFGYNECLDSFFGFGGFRLAREAKALPLSLIDLFSRVLHEEARHIVFFVNWIAYDRVRRGLRGPMQFPGAAVGYVRSLARLIGLVRGSAKDQNSREYGDAFSELSFSKITLRDFVLACLTENDVQMATLDPRLLRPNVIPAIARFALGFMRAQSDALVEAKPEPLDQLGHGSSTVD